LKELKVNNFENIYVQTDEQTGMQSIIALYSTKNGPALGGCRFKEYANFEEALTDATRLAKGMCYKSAIHNLPLGGGKSVILKNSIKPEYETSRGELFQSFGEFVNSLGGKYIAAVDIGTSPSDIDYIAERTDYVVCGKNSGGDASPHTADGVIAGMKAAVKFRLGKDDLKGIRVAIQGLGNVGLDLCRKLKNLGAEVFACDEDINKSEYAASRLGIKIVSPGEIYDVDCDVFAPCAIGATLNEKTIPRLKSPIVAGAANNQLAKPEDANRLQGRNILYCPDYVINGGGLIFAASNYLNLSPLEVKPRIENIYHTLMDIFEKARAQGATTAGIADMTAEERIKG